MIAAHRCWQSALAETAGLGLMGQPREVAQGGLTAVIGRQGDQHMTESTGDPDLVAKASAGDQEAARLIVNRYMERLWEAARKRISLRFASRVDPDDVVQSVFRTFFVRNKKGEFVIHDDDDLCKLLMRITINKTLRQIAKQRAGKRNPEREIGQGPDSGDCLQDISGREPTADEELAFLDHLEHFLGKLSPQERDILEMRLQGHSNEDIAQKLGVYDRKIRRVIERIRKRAEEEGMTPLGPAH